MNKEYRVLNHGFVRLVDVMGDDAAIVQAARTSYGAGTKTVSEDRDLIRYLMRNNHTSPFEMVEFKFHIKLPIFVARQWIRHRTANVNEYSGRYSEMRDEFYVPSPSDVKKQSINNKQGRSEEELSSDITDKFIEELTSSQTAQFNEYKKNLDDGIARELARIKLPLSVYTEWYWKIDLHNLLHFLKLRLDEHAQYEIRVYANIISDIVKSITPLAYEAFEDYRLESVVFSKKEKIAMAKILSKIDYSELNLTTEELLSFGLGKREASEFNSKIKNILNTY